MKFLNSNLAHLNTTLIGPTKSRWYFFIDRMQFKLIVVQLIENK